MRLSVDNFKKTMNIVKNHTLVRKGKIETTDAKVKIVHKFPCCLLLQSYRPKYELHKIRWEINPYDNDSNPKWSTPHGDDIYPKYHTLKLDVYSGQIYSARGGNHKGKLSRKELARLHNDTAFKKAQEEAQKYRGMNSSQYTREAHSFIVDLECIISP